MSRLAALLLALLLAAIASPAAAGSYAITADRDSWITELTTTQNNGSATALRATTGATGGARTRALIGFDLSSIPADETITSAALTLYVTTGGNTAYVHRVTDIWAENTVTWANTATDYNGSPEATFTPTTTSVTLSINVTSLVQGWRNGSFANNGLIVLGATKSSAQFASREVATPAQRPQLVVTTVRTAPSLLVLKSSSIVSDPYNGTNNPKLIPGATVRHTITASNSSSGTADSGSTAFTMAVPAGMQLYVADAGAAGSGPIVFANGTTSSGLSYTFTSLASTTDSVAFSNNNGSTFTYTPTANAAGADSNVTHVRITLTGAFAGKTGATDPTMTLQILMQPK